MYTKEVKKKTIRTLFLLWELYRSSSDALSRSGGPKGNRCEKGTGGKIVSRRIKDVQGVRDTKVIKKMNVTKGRERRKVHRLWMG